MCNCTNTNTISIPTRSRTQHNTNEPCDYTIEQLETWYNRLQCVKNNNFYTSLQTINVYLGVLQSAINSPLYICLFKINLDIIYGYIQSLIIDNICNE